MSSILTVQKQLSNDGWVLTATISPGGTLPQEIFVYENTGTTQLGPYYGVINALDLTRIQIFTGSVIPAFGNKFVRYGVGIINVADDIDPDVVIAMLEHSVQVLSTAYQSIQSSSQVFTIT